MENQWRNENRSQRWIKLFQYFCVCVLSLISFVSLNRAQPAPGAPRGPVSAGLLDLHGLPLHSGHVSRGSSRSYRSLVLVLSLWFLDARALTRCHCLLLFAVKSLGSGVSKFQRKMSRCPCICVNCQMLASSPSVLRGLFLKRSCLRRNLFRVILAISSDVSLPLSTQFH